MAKLSQLSKWEDTSGNAFNYNYGIPKFNIPQNVSNGLIGLLLDLALKKYLIKK